MTQAGMDTKTALRLLGMSATGWIWVRTASSRSQHKGRARLFGVEGGKGLIQPINHHQREYYPLKFLTVWKSRTVESCGIPSTGFQEN